MNIRGPIDTACGPTRPRKSPAHLLLLPVAFGVAGVFCYSLVAAACKVAALSRVDFRGFSSYGEPTKGLIVVPLLLASFPIGLLASNLLAWSIPPLRGFFDCEAEERPDGKFSTSMRGLLTFTKYWMPPFLAIGFGAALFGR